METLCVLQTRIKAEEKRDYQLWHLSVPVDLSLSQQVLSWIERHHFWCQETNATIHYLPLGTDKDKKGGK